MCFEMAPVGVQLQKMKFHIDQLNHPEVRNFGRQSPTTIRLGPDVDSVGQSVEETPHLHEWIRIHYPRQKRNTKNDRIDEGVPPGRCVSLVGNPSGFVRAQDEIECGKGEMMEQRVTGTREAHSDF